MGGLKIFLPQFIEMSASVMRTKNEQKTKILNVSLVTGNAMAIGEIIFTKLLQKTLTSVVTSKSLSIKSDISFESKTFGDFLSANSQSQSKDEY